MNRKKSIKICVPFSEKQIQKIDEIVDCGEFGDNRSIVVKQIILNHLNK